jgi:hypothetical protein
MQDIAHRTERETVSMHTITVVTLLFLPATFLSVSTILRILLRHPNGRERPGS